MAQYWEITIKKAAVKIAVFQFCFGLDLAPFDRYFLPTNLNPA